MKLQRITITALQTLLIVATTAAVADPVSEFLLDVDRQAALSSPSNAVVLIQRALDSHRYDASGAAFCKIAQARHSFMMEGNEDVATEYAMQVINTDGLDAHIKLAAIDVLMQGNKTTDFTSRAYVNQKACETALNMPEFAVARPRGLLLYNLGISYANRTFHDLAYISLLKAADLLDTPQDRQTKIAALYAAAKSAQKYRSIADADVALKKIEQIEDLSPQEINQLNFEKGCNLIMRDQFAWTADSESLKTANACIAKAIRGHNGVRSLTREEIAKANFALLEAEDSLGNYENAIGAGKKIVDAKTADSLDRILRGNIEVRIADIMVKAGLYKEAIKYYERGAKSNSFGGPKPIYLRLAKAARAARDYGRAQQAYLDCLQYCDYVEGKDELNRLRNLAVQMGNASRKKVDSTRAEDLFENDNESLKGISLDEI